MRLRLPSVDVRAGLWFVLLSLAVAGPLLGSGYLLLLDFPSGPQFPEVPVFPLPSSGVVGNDTPLRAIHALLREIYQYLPDKVFLLAPIIIGGFGIYRFTRTRLGIGAAGAIFGGTLFVINPFVYDRYTAGHLYFLLAYALLPWTLAALYDLLRDATRRRALIVALWILVVGAVEVHMLGIFMLLFAVMFVWHATRRHLVVVGAALLLGVLLSAFWLLPGLLHPVGGAIGPADLDTYVTRPRGFMVLPNLFAMNGFWRGEFQSSLDRVPSLALLLLPLLGLVSLGAITVLNDHRRRLALGLVSAAFLGLLLGAGTSFPPTAGIFRWLFEHVLFFPAFREPQKFLALTVLGYAVFGAAGLNRFSRRTPAPGWLSAAATLMVVAYGYTLFWGFGGQFGLSSFPQAWSRVNYTLQQSGTGRLLVLPWTLYSGWSFTDGRIVANPARSYFAADTLVGDEAGLGGVPLQSPDPYSRYMSLLLEDRERLRNLGDRIAPLGIRYIALLHERDWLAYSFLDTQSGISTVLRARTITLYENKTWRDSPQPLEEVALRKPLAPAAPVSFPPLARPLPIWSDIESPAGRDSFVGSDARCTDGWLLNHQEPVCHLGAIGAYPRSATPGTHWRPMVGATVAGYVISLGALATTVASFRQRKVREDTRRSSPWRQSSDG